MSLTWGTDFHFLRPFEVHTSPNFTEVTPPRDRGISKHICFWHFKIVVFKFSCKTSKHSKNSAMLNCIYRIPRRTLNAVLFAACFCYKTSLIALVVTDCPSILIQSYCNFGMPSNPNSIREHHLSLQRSADSFPTKAFGFKSFCYN